MKYVATFEHGKKQWCVQLIEQGPCPIVAYCDSEQEAIDQADLCNKFPKAVNVIAEVAGRRISMSHGDFERACLALIHDIQQDPHCHLGLIHILCEAVRCSRECCDLSSELQSLAHRNLEKAKSECTPYFHHPNS